MSTTIEVIEHIITALMNKTQLPPDADPKLVQVIEGVLMNIEAIEPSPEFTAQLAMQVREKLSQKRTVYQKIGDKMHSTFFLYGSAATVLLVITGVAFISSKPEDQFQNMPIVQPKTSHNLAMGESADTTAGRGESTSLFDSFSFGQLKQVSTNNGVPAPQAAPMPTLTSIEKATMRLDFHTEEEQFYNDMDQIAPSPVQEWRYREIAPLAREQYENIESNAIKKVADMPLSTFSIDVDTASYANVRRLLTGNQLPPKDAVRVEEMINYFGYDYVSPQSSTTPFSVHTEISTTPWNSSTQLLHIGIKGYEHINEQLLPTNLVFLIDVSGSMNSEDKLPLLKKSMLMLAESMNVNDRLSIVVYAGASGLVLDGAEGADYNTIAEAIEKLSAGGSTHGSAGIQLAYETARQHFIHGGINRVILATDGDFNVGTTSTDDLIKLIEEQREDDIFLTALGFGQGNLNDHMMEQLADHGNGNYGYIDSLQEAQKLLVNERSSTLQTIAKDVKIQLEFNPGVIKSYRLIGYENRALADKDFANDTVDAGEIGAGHTVTALYEVSLDRTKKLDANETEVGYLKIRYKAPTGDTSKLIDFPIELHKALRSADKTTADFRFSAAIAAFGQRLRGGEYLNGYSYDAIKDLAEGSIGEDRYGYRNAFLELVKKAKSIDMNAIHEPVEEIELRYR